MLVKKMRVAPTHEEWRNYVDGGDLFMDGQRVEVKGIRYPFTSREDWPFPDVIVCACHQFDRADPKPLLYFYVNPAGTHVAIVKASTSDQWWTEEVTDRNYQGITQLSYKTTKDNTEFKELSYGEE